MPDHRVRLTDFDEKTGVSDTFVSLPGHDNAIQFEILNNETVGILIRKNGAGAEIEIPPKTDLHVHGNPGDFEIKRSQGTASVTIGVVVHKA